MRRSVGLILALLLIVLLAEDADAQRRRRRRRAPRPVETSESVDAGTGPDSSSPDDRESAPSSEGEEASSEGEEATPEGTPSITASEGGDASEEGSASSEVTETTAPTDTSPDSEDAPVGPDISAVREEFTSVMDELVDLRSRIAVLGRQLFQTKIRVDIDNRAGDEQVLGGVTLTLDGAPIFRSEGGLSEDGQRAFDGFASPGPHEIGVQVEQRSREDDSYRYAIDHAFRFEVLRGKLTEVLIVLDDDSSIAEDFPDDGEGEYDVRTRFRVATRDIDAR